MTTITPQTALLAAQTLPATPEGRDAPEWIHLLPSGEVRTLDNRGPYHVADPKQVIALSFASADRLPIDENHATDLAAPKGGPAPARGWIVAMEARPDGIWGKVEWTAEGRQLVADRAYRGISPVILHTKGNGQKVVGIARASLVNNPNLRGLSTLHQQQEKDMSLSERLAEILGLKDDTGDDAIVTAVQAASSREDDTGAALQSRIGEIATALGLANDATPDDVLTAAQAAVAQADATVTALQSEVVTLTESMNALTEGAARGAAESFVDGAIRAGRAGVKPQRARFIAMHMKDKDGTEAIINDLPAINGDRVAPLVPQVTVALNATELAAAGMAYQRKQAEAGFDIDIVAAIRAVQEGKK